MAKLAIDSHGDSHRTVTSDSVIWVHIRYGNKKLITFEVSDMYGDVDIYEHSTERGKDRFFHRFKNVNDNGNA